MNKQALRLIAVFVVVLVASWVVAYFVFRQFSPSAPPAAVSPSATQAPPAAVDIPPGSSAREREEADLRARAEREKRAAASGGENTFLTELFGERSLPGTGTQSTNWLELIGLITLRFLLAAGLATALAFRPRRQFTALKSNPSVAQTQILLAVVASALMMIVGDSAARAFGIFAAASLVRFRTNIRDPKEITVLLVSLAIGLASGVGRWELAVMLSVSSLLLLWILEAREPAQIFRAMQLKVTARNIEATQEMVRSLLEKHEFSSELRTLSRTGADEPGTIVYHIDMSPTVSTDQLSDEIFVAGSGNVVSVEWDQKKSFSYVYQ